MNSTERSKKHMKILSEYHQRPHPVTLNDLPQTAIDEILTHLPIKTAVGTSLISRFWRYRWRCKPNLVFLYPPENFVTNTLLLHSGSIQLFQYFGRVSPAVDCWIVALSSRAADSLQSLILRFFTMSDRKYHLHSSAYSFHHLTNISFHNCVLTPPCNLSGFKQLESLTLEEVSFPDARQLSSLFSNSPCLRIVSLVKVAGKGCLKITGPNICRLKCECVDFDDLALGSCPLLRHANIRLASTSALIQNDQSYDGDDCDETQWLCLGRHSSENLVTNGIPERNPINLDHLSVMSLGMDFTDIKSISAMICLVRSCCNLKELELTSVYLAEVSNQDCKDIWEEQAHFDLFPKLEIVQMRDLTFDETELALIRLILGTAQVLRLLEISLDSADYCRKDRESAMIKMLAFRRASNQAIVVCKC